MGRLHEAAKAGSVEQMETLLAESACNVNKGDERGLTALFWACVHGHLPAVEFLVNHNASLNVQAKDGETALHYASSNGHLPIVEFLSRHGASLNIPDKMGSTALHEASFNGHLPIVEFLSRHGVSLNVPDKTGETTLHLASFKGHLPVVEFLVNHGVSLNVQAKNGLTALHKASFKGHLPVVEFLVNHGASLNVLNKKGKTAVDVAKTDEIRQFLGKVKQAMTEAEARRSAIQVLLPVSAMHAAQKYLEEAQTMSEDAQSALGKVVQQLKETEEKHTAAQQEIEEDERRIAEAERERADLCDRLRVLDAYLKDLRTSHRAKTALATQREQLNNQHTACRGISDCASRILQEARTMVAEHEKTLTAWQDRVAKTPPPSSLSVSDVCVFLDAIGLGSHAPLFHKNGITGDMLLCVCERDTDLHRDLGMDCLVDRLRLSYHVHRLAMGHLPSLRAPCPGSSSAPPAVVTWDVDRVVSWLGEHGLSGYGDAFRRERITGEAATMLGSDHLRDIIGVQRLDDRLALQDAVMSLRTSVFPGHDDLRGTHKDTQMEAGGHWVMEYESELCRLRDETESLRKRVLEGIPDNFLCPITQCVMEDPVVCVDGHTYERMALEHWLRDHDTSPMTGEQLSNKSVLSNHTLCKVIRGFIEKCEE